MAKLSVLGPFVEADLGHELGPHPMDPFSGKLPRLERRLALLQGRQLPGQVRQRLPVESGPDLACVHEPAVLVVAHQEGSEEPGPVPLRIGVAADDDLLFCDALELKPVLGSRPDVG